MNDNGKYSPVHMDTEIIFSVTSRFSFSTLKLFCELLCHITINFTNYCSVINIPTFMKLEHPNPLSDAKPPMTT